MFDGECLLFPCSKIFEKSSPIDIIHQSIIDLNSNPSNDQIETLLINIFLFLDNDINSETLNELIILTNLCFSRITDQNSILNKMYDKSKENSNKLIVFTSILSNIKEISDFPNVASFIIDVSKQIYEQIQDPKEKFKIFDLTIKEEFKADFICNITLTTKISEKVVSNFFPLIFSQKNLSQDKIIVLYEKVRDANLVEFLPEQILINTEVVKLFSQENFASLIPKTSKQIFTQILPNIEQIFSVEKNINKQFVTSILDKCIEFDINFSLIDKKKQIFYHLNELMIKNEYWDFFVKNEMIVPERLTNQINEYPIKDSVLYSISNFNNFPANVLFEILSESNDIQIFERIANFLKKQEIFEVEICPESSFWVHVFTVISSSKQKYSDILVVFLATQFKFNVDEKDFYVILNNMILNNYPASNYGNCFLIDFIDETKLRNSHDYIEFLSDLLTKVIEIKGIPHPSFWNIFPFDLIEKFLNDENESTILNMAYHSTKPYYLDNRNLFISAELYNKYWFDDFISSNEFDLNDIRQELFDFIITAKIYIKQENKSEISGLTNKMILPFFAKCLLYIDEIGGNLLIESDELKKLFLNACELLPSSRCHIDISSIDLILTLTKYVIDESIFPSDIAFEMYDILVNQLIDDVYGANKSLLLTVLLDFQLQNKSHPIVKKLFEKNGIGILKLFTENYKDIDKFKDNFLDMKVFNSILVSSLLDDMIQKTLNEKIVNTIYFFEKYCVNIPKIKLKYPNKLISIIDKMMSKNDSKKAFALIEFIQKNVLFKNYQDLSLFNRIKLSKKIIEELIYNITNQQNIVEKNSLIECLLNIMINDSSIIFYYIPTKFEINRIGNSLDSYNFFQCLTNEIILNCDVVKKSIQNYFGYLYDKFIWKMAKNTFSFTKYCHLIISKLYEESSRDNGNYSVFYILKNISLTFPFIFNENPKKLFDVACLTFQSFHHYFSDPDAYDMRYLKTSLVAQSFLFSALHSVEVLESFLQWFFDNICSVYTEVVLVLTFFLDSLFHTKKIKDVLLSLAIKNDFAQKAANLLSQEEHRKEIRQIYKTNILNLLLTYYKNLNKLNHKKKLILIDEIKKSEKPVSQMFNNYLTIYPINIQPLNLPNSNNEEIKKFIEKVNETRNFNVNNCNYSLNNSDFKKYFKFPNLEKQEQKIPKNLDNIKFPKKIFDEIECLRIVSKSQNWIYRWYIKGEKFQLLNEHYNSLKKVADELRIKKKNKDKKKFDQIDVYEIFSDAFEDKGDLFDILIEEIALNNDQLSIQLFKLLIQNKKLINCFLKSINSYIDRNLYNTESIKNLLHFINENNISENDLFKVCSKSLINFALTPKVRNDDDFISSIIEKLTSLDEIPYQASQIIELYLINHPNEDFYYILKICKKIGCEKLGNMNRIMNLYIAQLLKDKESLDQTVIDIFDAFPSLLDINMPFAIDVVKVFIQKYNDGDDVIYQIYELFNSISPKRNENQIEIIFNESSTDSNTIEIIKQAPQNLVETNPQFWNLFNENIEIIKNFIQRNENNFSKSKFLTNFYELVNFEIRLNCFRKVMHDKRRNYSNYLYINRSDLFNSSYNELKNKSKNDWLKNFHISFNNEDGQDAGGLTKEWLTIIVNEIFSQNLNLFTLKETNCYHPSSNIKINEENLDYFRFAGKIVARALIQELYVNAHLTSSFRKQILKKNLVLKDLEDFDDDIYSSLKSLLENDASESYLNFSITNEEGKEIPLKENGENIDVTNENKEEYVNLFIDYKLRSSIIDQMKAFCDGFNWLIPHEEICYFSQNELDLIIRGNSKIDVEDMKANTIYEYPYYKDHPVIIMFFNVISKWTQEQLEKLLFFITGSSKVPINGFSELAERSRAIKIDHINGTNKLCRAHTCFNTIDLPEYESEEKLEEKLLLSINECVGYGFG